MLRSIVLLCFLALASSAAYAQDSVANAHDYRPVLGLRVGPPLRAAFNIGLAHGHYKPGGFLGTAIILEAGSGGGQVSVARVAGSPFGSARVQLSALRTWGDPGSVAPRQTFLGLEARLMFGVGIGLGFYGRISGTTRGDGHLVVVNLVAGI